MLHGAAASRDVKHFTDERNVLLTQLRGRELTGAWLEYTLELAAVNAALWRAEDEIRDLKAAGTPAGFNAAPVVELAFRIPTLNDRRAELVTLINVNTGEHRGEEKV